MLIYLLPPCCCPAIRCVDHEGGGLRRGAHAGLVLRDGWVQSDAWLFLWVCDCSSLPLIFIVAQAHFKYVRVLRTPWAYAEPARVSDFVLFLFSENDREFRHATCLCGSAACRGSFLYLSKQDSSGPLQQVGLRGGWSGDGGGGRGLAARICVHAWRPGKKPIGRCCSVVQSTFLAPAGCIASIYSCGLWPPITLASPQYAMTHHTFLDRCRLLLQVAAEQHQVVSKSELACLARHGFGESLFTDGGFGIWLCGCNAALDSRWSQTVGLAGFVV